MIIEFSEETIETRRGFRRVLVAQPAELITLDRAEVESRADGRARLSLIDQQIVHTLARSKYEVVVFRGGSNDDGPRYVFDPAIPDSDLPQVGRALVMSQLPLYRELAKHGVIVTVAVELGDRELLAFRGGTAALVYESENSGARGPGGTERFDLDLWLLRHMTLFSALSLEGAMTQLLPTSVPMLEPRLERIKNLV